MKHSDKGHSTAATADNTPVLTVLLVDGSLAIRQAVREYLEPEGYTVVTATDGFEAMASIIEHRPSLVLADLLLPRLDGYQTCALIKNNADFRDISVVLLSSKEGFFDKVRGRIVGSDAHLSKPFTADSLLAVVRHHTAVSAPAPDSPAITTSKAGKSPETTDA